MYPTDRRYSKEHEWVKVSGQVATRGITDFAQHELGDIVYVELPEIGRTIAPGEVLGTIESVKAVSEIYAPGGAWVSGTLTLCQGSTPDGATKPGPCAINCTNDREVYSFHPAGANAVFADGSLHFLKDDIDIRIFARLVTRAGGEVVTIP